MNFRAKVRHFSLKCKLDFAKIGFSLKILAYLCVVDRVESEWEQV